MNNLYRDYLQEGERIGLRYSLLIPQDAMRGATGLHLGRQAGSSLDFKDFREYQPGDDLRQIDWNIFARSDRLIVKMYREEVNPRLDILLDGSRSMALEETAKPRAALGLAAILATAAANAGCVHNTWLADENVRPVTRGNDYPSVWDDIEFRTERNPADTLQAMPPPWGKYGMRILISDLLWIGDPLLILRPLAEGAANVTVIQLLARADARPPSRGNLRLEDVETGVRLDVFVDALAEQRYETALARHQQNWHRACRQTGARLITLIAENITERWNLDALEEEQILGAV